MTEAPLHIFAHGPLPAGVGEVLMRLRRTPGVARLAVMPDVHLASEFCVGTVVASQDTLFPNAVGGDIGCGMLALQFDSPAENLADPDRAARLLGLLYELCPARRHHHRTAHALPAPLAETQLSHAHLNSIKNSEASRTQLGTLGSGNHFLEFQRDESDNSLWLMLHTGSRHLGQTILHHHLPKARRLETGIFAIAADSPEGRAYEADVTIARAWARENRRLLALSAARVVETILGIAPRMESLHDCDHNHLTRETHDGTELFIHRKGATAAGPGTSGIIPGSMGTRSFHTMGRGNGLALHSSSHGAGRALSRTEARSHTTISALRQQMRGIWYDARLERSLLEESPKAYKNINDVMTAQSELTTITRRLRPILVYKGA